MTSLRLSIAAGIGGAIIGMGAILAVAGSYPQINGNHIVVNGRTSHTVVRPRGTTSQLLPSGSYILTLNPTGLTGGGRLPSSAHSTQLGAILTHSGSHLSMRVDNAVNMSGTENGSAMSASGNLPQGALYLQGTAQAGSAGARGNFRLTNGTGKTVLGTFTLVPGVPRPTAHRASNGSPPTITDRILHWVFGDGGCGWFYKC